MKLYRLELRLLNDFQTAGENRGSTIDVLRSAFAVGEKIEERLVIPASHIKGLLRQEARRLGVEKEIVGDIFGSQEQENRDGGYKEPAVKFFDLHAPLDALTERVHVKISLKYGSNSKNEGGLYSQKLVPQETLFTGYIALKGDNSEKHVEILKASLKSAQHYGIGGERSRGLGGFEADMKEIDVSDFKMEVFS